MRYCFLNKDVIRTTPTTPVYSYSINDFNTLIDTHITHQQLLQSEYLYYNGDYSLDESSITKRLMKLRLIGAASDYGTRDGIKNAEAIMNLDGIYDIMLVDENEGYIVSYNAELEKTKDNMMTIKVMPMEGFIESVLRLNIGNGNIYTLDKLVTLRDKLNDDTRFFNTVTQTLYNLDQTNDLIIAKIKRVSLQDMQYENNVIVNNFKNEVLESINFEKV